MESQRTLNSQNNVEKEKQIWRLTLLDSKTYYKATISKEYSTSLQFLEENTWKKLCNTRTFKTLVLAMTAWRLHHKDRKQNQK